MTSIIDSAVRHEGLCRSLAAQLASAWLFDPVYSGASTSVPKDASRAAVAKLSPALPLAVDAAAMKTAPPRVRELASWAGGVQGQQRLFATTPLEDTVLFATLWPWTEDDGITLRLGLWHSDARISDRHELAALVCGWLGLLQ